MLRLNRPAYFGHHSLKLLTEFADASVEEETNEFQTDQDGYKRRGNVLGEEVKVS
jgi:hypothetical protein